MEQDEKVWLAKIALDKRMDFEQLKYSDYLYGRESLAEDVWELVEECEAIGHIAFDAKYETHQ